QRAGAAGDDQADVSVLLIVDANGLVDRLGHFFAAHRDFEPDGPGALVEAIDVLLETKDLAVVNAYALEDAIAVKEAMVVDADLRIVPIVQLAVDVDLRHRLAPMPTRRRSEPFLARASG